MQNYLELEQRAREEQASRLAEARHDALVREARAGRAVRSAALTLTLSQRTHDAHYVE